MSFEGWIFFAIFGVAVPAVGALASPWFLVLTPTMFLLARMVFWTPWPWQPWSRV